VLGALGGNAQVYGTTESTESTEDATLYVLGALGGNAQVYGTTESTAVPFKNIAVYVLSLTNELS
jgi:hypothetical protein